MISILVEEKMAKTNAKLETQPPHPINVDVLATHYQKTFEVAYD